MAPTAIVAPLNGKTRIAAFPLFVWMAEAKFPRAGRPTSHVATVYAFWVSLQPVRNIACLGPGVWGLGCMANMASMVVGVEATCQ